MKPAFQTDKAQKIKELSSAIAECQEEIKTKHQSRKTLLKEISELRKKISDLKYLRRKLIMGKMMNE